MRRAVRIAFEPTPVHIAHWVISGSALAVLLTLTVVLLDGRVYGWEIDVVRELQKPDYPDRFFDITANHMTNSDTPVGGGIVLSVAALLWFLRLRIETLMVLFIGMPLHIVVNFPKIIVERERPDAYLGAADGAGSLKSFPSGHAEFVVTFYGFLLYLALLHVKTNYLRVVLIAAWFAMAVSIGLARIEATRHWPLDLIGGYIVGVGALSLLIWVHDSLTRATRGERGGTD